MRIPLSVIPCNGQSLAVELTHQVRVQVAAGVDVALIMALLICLEDNRDESGKFGREVAKSVGEVIGEALVGAS